MALLAAKRWVVVVWTTLERVSLILPKRLAEQPLLWPKTNRCTRVEPVVITVPDPALRTKKASAIEVTSAVTRTLVTFHSNPFSAERIPDPWADQRYRRHRHPERLIPDPLKF